jgi:hypothetical protein
LFLIHSSFPSRTLTLARMESEQNNDRFPAMAQSKRERRRAGAAPTRVPALARGVTAAPGSLSTPRGRGSGRSGRRRPSPAGKLPGSSTGPDRVVPLHLAGRAGWAAGGASRLPGDRRRLPRVSQPPETRQPHSPGFLRCPRRPEARAQGGGGYAEPGARRRPVPLQPPKPGAGGWR